jgi:hypothetical protein
MVGVAYGLVMIAQAPSAGPVAPPVTQAATSRPMWVPPQPTQPQMIIIVPVPQQFDAAQKPADAQNTPAEFRFTIPESWGGYIGWGIAIAAVALLLLGVDPGPLLKHVAL